MGRRVSETDYAMPYEPPSSPLLVIHFIIVDKGEFVRYQIRNLARSSNFSRGWRRSGAKLGERVKPGLGNGI